MLEESFFQIVYPLFYIFLIVIYTFFIIFKLKKRKSFRLMDIKKYVKYFIIPYAGKNWRWKAGIILAEVVLVITIVTQAFGKMEIKQILIMIAGYMLLNIYVLVAFQITEYIIEVLSKNIKDVEILFIFIVPFFIFFGGMFVAESNCIVIIQTGAYVMLLAFVVSYVKFQQILIDYVFYGYNRNNDVVDMSERRISVLIFNLLIDILILISGGVTLFRFFPNSFCEGIKINDVIYDTVIAFFTLGEDTVKASGFLGKSYNILVLIASIIMFSCYLGYMLGKKKAKLTEREHDEKEKDEIEESDCEKANKKQAVKRFDNFLSAKLLLDITMQEYQNEHNRTSVIDTKTNIALPIIATYLFLILEKMNIPYYEKQIEDEILSLMDAELQIGMIIIAIILAILSSISMFMTIKTDQYTILKVEDFYKPEYIALEEDKFAAAIIHYIITASQENKKVNDDRVKKYKFGLVMVGCSLLAYMIYMILQ